MRSSSKIQLENIDGEVINPATEDKGLIGNTQADGLGTKYHIVTDSSGRIHTRSFRNASGDGRRMLVDDDRHGQVDVLTLPFPAGTGTNSTRTLTALATAYSVPTTAPTKNYVLVLYNSSDTDMFIGYQNTNANGIELPSGGRMSFDLGASQQVFAYCASAGKVLTYSLKELT